MLRIVPIRLTIQVVGKSMLMKAAQKDQIMIKLTKMAIPCIIAQILYKGPVMSQIKNKRKFLKPITIVDDFYFWKINN